MSRRSSSSTRLDSINRRINSIDTSYRGYRYTTDPEKNFTNLVRNQFKGPARLARSTSELYLSDYNPMVYTKPFTPTPWSFGRGDVMPRGTVEDPYTSRYDLYHPSRWAYPIWRYIHRSEKYSTDGPKPFYYQRYDRRPYWYRPSYLSSGRAYDTWLPTMSRYTYSPWTDDYRVTWRVQPFKGGTANFPRGFTKAIWL